MKPNPARIDHWERVVRKITKCYCALDDASKAAINAGALAPEGPLDNAMWHAFDVLLEQFDLDGWIGWFLFENKGGKRKPTAPAVIDGKRVLIKTPRDLARVLAAIEQDES